MAKNKKIAEMARDIRLKHRWIALSFLVVLLNITIVLNPYFIVTNNKLIIMFLISTIVIISCLSKIIRKQVIFNPPKRTSSDEEPYKPTTFPPMDGRVTQRIKLGDIISPKTENPLYVDDSDISKHMVIVGQSGSGKTVGVENILWQQIRRGGGACFIDGKLDGDTLVKIKQMMFEAGRIDDLLLLNPNLPPDDNKVLSFDPENIKDVSHTYNPLLRGDTESIVNRIMSTQGGGGAPSATSEHFQAMNKAGLTVVIDAIKELEVAFSFEDLSIVLSSPQAIQELWRMLPKNSKAKINLATYLEGMTIVNMAGQKELSSKKFMDNLGGIAARMQTLASGGLGKIMNTYTPQIDLYDAITGNKVVYVMLPSMEKLTTTARYLAQFLISDLQTAVAKVQELKQWEKPAIPYLLLFDEFGAYATYSSSVIWEQGRSARICACAAFQTFSSLEALGVDFRNKIMGNSMVKIFYALRDPDSPNIASQMLGYMEESTTEMAIDVKEDVETGEKTTKKVSKKSGSTQKIGANEFRELMVGEAIVSIERDIYKIKGPLIEGYSSVNRGEDIQLTYNRGETVPGLNFYKIWTKLLKKEYDFDKKPEFNSGDA